MSMVDKIADPEDWLVLFDDDDPPPSEGSLGEVVRLAERLASDASVGGVGLRGARFDRRRGRIVRVPTEELSGAVPVGYLSGNALPAYRIGAIRRAGVLDDRLFFGKEELEYGLRLAENGYSLYAAGDAWRPIRINRGRLTTSATLSLRRPPSWRDYYRIRNLIFVLRRHGDPWAAVRISLTVGLLKPMVNLFLRPSDAVRLLTANIRAMRDGWLGRMGRAAWATPPTRLGASGPE
jgi:GT2 family glycosyltransferase